MESKYNFAKEFKDAVTRCSRCGFCQAVCPVYGATLRPAYNARGKMLLLKEVMDGNLDFSEEMVETLFQCTTCAACANNCPSSVCVPDVIKAARKDMVSVGTCHPAFSGMNELLETADNIYSEEDEPDFRDDRKVDEEAEYVFFIGCVGNFREEDATEETLELLDRLKVDYTLISEVCCTGVLEDVGFSIHQSKADKNIELIMATGAKTVITGCPYCFRTFNNKGQYDALREAGIKVIHISQFMKDFDFGVTTDLKVTYHDPCDLGRHSGIYEEPRETIRKIAPNFVELPSNRANALCCGSGGGVRGAFPTNSIAMSRRRLDEVEKVGADVLLTECNSCVHNLQNAKLRKQPFKIFTTTQFINMLMDDAD